MRKRFQRWDDSNLFHYKGIVICAACLMTESYYEQQFEKKFSAGNGIKPVTRWTEFIKSRIKEPDARQEKAVNPAKSVVLEPAFL